MAEGYIIEFIFDDDFKLSMENINFVCLHNVMNMFNYRSIGDTTFVVDGINHDTISCAIMVERLKHYDWFMSSIKNIKLHKIEETTDLTRIVIYDK